MQCSFSVWRRTILLAAIPLVLAPLTHHSAGREEESWYGTWNLNFGKSSDRSDASRYKRVTIRIEPWEGGLRVAYDMVGTRGGITHIEWTGRFDGKDYPVQGVDEVLTNAYRGIDDHAYEIVVKRDGVVVAAARVAVSSDGRQLHVATEERTASGQTVNTTAIYDKQ